MTLEEIKDKYSMMDILNRLNIPVKKGFCKCPFHLGDNTASCKIYDKSFFCFGCGKGGDFIYFVELYHNLRFEEACEWISGETLPKRSRRALAVADIKRKIIREKNEKLRKQLKDLKLAHLWNVYQTAEPFSDEWTDAYNQWQIGVYKQNEIMKELGL
jgi:DNA primase